MTPENGSEGDLIVLEGINMGEIRELLFNGEPIAFNTAFNSDVALLFRIPVGTPLGETTVTVRTDGGSFDFPFTVNREPPSIGQFFPRTANPGERVTITGSNFFGPVEVYFRSTELLPDGEQDSILAELVVEKLDTIVAIVPENASTGAIAVRANGGLRFTRLTFQVFVRELVTDFDGNGVRPDNDALSFTGFTDQQNGAPFIRSSLPAPLDGNFLQLSGTDDLGTIWMGGAETRGGPEVEAFGITTSVTNTFLEMDVNNNGRSDSYLLLVLREQNGRPGDFTSRVAIDEEGWHKVRIPLIRFTDSQNRIINPAAVNQIKFHIEDTEETGRRIEVNIDNVIFVESS